MGTDVIDMGWALLWGTSCDLLKPPLFKNNFIKKMHFQKATHFFEMEFWLMFVLAWQCFVPALVLVQSWHWQLFLALQSKWKANVSKV